MKTLTTIYETLFRIGGHPSLSGIGSPISFVLIPLGNIVLAIEMLLRVYSAKVGFMTQVFYWPAELVADFVDNFFGVLNFLRKLVLFYAMPYILAYFLDANETIVDLTIWIPLFYFSMAFLSVTSLWVITKSEQLIESSLVKNQKPEDPNNTKMSGFSAKSKSSKKFFL